MHSDSRQPSSLHLLYSQSHFQVIPKRLPRRIELHQASVGSTLLQFLIFTQIVLQLGLIFLEMVLQLAKLTLLRRLVMAAFVEMIFLLLLLLIRVVRVDDSIKEAIFFMSGQDVGFYT